MKKADIKNLSVQGILKIQLAEALKLTIHKLKLAHRISPIENPIQVSEI